jgi:hypothetical protein
MLAFIVHKVNLFYGSSRDKTDGYFKKFLCEETAEQDTLPHPTPTPIPLSMLH